MLIYNTDTPILFLIFNRPDTTQQVFNAIRRAKPKKLYIAADGPRNNTEYSLCEQARSIAMEIDWSCEVKTLFRNRNKGCKQAMSEGISWFFEQELEGIILEDDCLPSDSFFGFCSALLEKYRYDTRITHIGGSNLQLGNLRGTASYYFSRLSHVWGWAGWRRVWKDYDVKMASYPIFKETNILSSIPSHQPFDFLWNHVFQETFEGRIDTWDYQYAYLNLINNGLSIIPNTNLISNIGFGKDATHTLDTQNIYAGLTTENLNRIDHPHFIIPDLAADLFTQTQETKHYRQKNKSFLSRTWKKIKLRLKG